MPLRQNPGYICHRCSLVHLPFVQCYVAINHFRSCYYHGGSTCSNVLVKWLSLREKRPNTEFFLVRIFLYSDWIQENTDKKKLRIWTIFTQCIHYPSPTYLINMSTFLLWFCLTFLFLVILFCCYFHCVKSVQIHSYFWSVFSCIRTKYEELLRKSSYSVRIQEKTEQK